VRETMYSMWWIRADGTRYNGGTVFERLDDAVENVKRVAPTVSATTVRAEIRELTVGPVMNDFELVSTATQIMDRRALEVRAR